MKIIPCIIGLGYVGLPITLNLAKRFLTYGFDTNKKRIENLKNKIDVNREFESKKFNNIKKIIFTNKIKDIKKCNFFILCLPTPIHKNKKPDLINLNDAIKIISKNLKKNDIIFIESTIYPSVTEIICIPILEKNSVYGEIIAETREKNLEIKGIDSINIDELKSLSSNWFKNFLK